MSNDTDTPTNPETNVAGNQRQLFRMTDDLIAMIRELVQLSFLTGTNIVDHMRSIVVEPVGENKITVAPEYVHAYNNMVTQLQAASEQAQAENASTDSAQ